TLALVPPCAPHLVSKPDVGVGAMVLGHPFHVAEYLRLRRERAAPVGVELERVGVQVRWHIAAAAGVAVLAPSPADLIRPLEHNEVVDASLRQPGGHAQTA